MTPQRILVMMIEPPLPFGNAAARWYYVLLKGLVERGHRVTAFATCSRPHDVERARALFPAPAYDLRLYPHPQRRGPGAKLETLARPYSYMFSPELKRDLDDEIGRGYDVLHLMPHWSGWLVPPQMPRTVLEVHYLFDIDLADQESPTWHHRALRILSRRAERRILRSFSAIKALTPRLTERIRELNPRATVYTVPLGLDFSGYPFRPDRAGSDPGAPVVSLIGTFGWGPTLSAGKRLLGRLWPEIKRRVPEARLQIVGWSARSALKEFAGMPDVSIEENVPEIRPYFDRTTLLLYAPSRGSGIKVKVLEAMAFGVPVVTTSEGVEGLPAEDGVHAGVCEDDAGLIERAVALLRDPERQDRQRRAARRLVETCCGPTPTLDATESIYADLADHPRTAGRGRSNRGCLSRAGGGPSGA